jgi:Ca-activated chloride channel family protein
MIRLTKPPQIMLLLLAACLCLSLPGFSQSRSPLLPPEPPAPGKPAADPIRVGVNMVLVPISVVDPYDRLVTGLEQSNFRVFENGVEQEIVHFSSEDVPISVGLIFDMSGSMSDKVDKSRQAAVQFLKTANPQDEFFMVSFSNEARLITPFTSNLDRLETDLLTTPAKGRTALLDAIYLGLSEMKYARNSRKALLIISDGGDNHSRYTENDVRRFLREADTQVYAIGVFEPASTRCDLTPEECEGPSLLQELCDMSGGRLFSVQNLNELPDIATKISMELRNEYVLGYKPSDRRKDGRWRKIKVRLDPPRGLPPLTVYAKYGYYAPGR